MGRRLDSDGGAARARPRARPGSASGGLERIGGRRRFRGFWAAKAVTESNSARVWAASGLRSGWAQVRCRTDHASSIWLRSSDGGAEPKRRTPMGLRRTRIGGDWPSFPKTWTPQLKGAPGRRFRLPRQRHGVRDESGSQGSSTGAGPENQTHRVGPRLYPGTRLAVGTGEDPPVRT